MPSPRYSGEPKGSLTSPFPEHVGNTGACTTSAMFVALLDVEDEGGGGGYADLLPEQVRNTRTCTRCALFGISLNSRRGEVLQLQMPFRVGLVRAMLSEFDLNFATMHSMLERKGFSSRRGRK